MMFYPTIPIPFTHVYNADAGCGARVLQADSGALAAAARSAPRWSPRRTRSPRCTD